MARIWKGLRSEAVSDGRLDESRDADAKARQLAKVRTHRLAELREALGLTQVALAERLRVSQSRVSRIERGAIDHTQLETLRAYLEARTKTPRTGVTEAPRSPAPCRPRPALCES